LSYTHVLYVLVLLSLAYLYHLLTRPLIFQRPLSPQARAAALRKSYADMPPPYPNAWFKLCDAMDVDGGKTPTIFALGRQLTVGRDARGELWCEDTDGQLWEVCEANRVIFVWHDEMRRSSAWQIPVASDKINEWRFVGRTTHEIVCHIQEIPENGADTAHLDYLHGDFVLNFISGARHTWEASWIPQPHPHTHLAKIAIDTQVSFFGHRIPMSLVRTRITQVGPGIVQLMFPTLFGNILLQETITPMHSNIQRASHVLYCEPSVPRLVAKAIMKSTLIQFERDFVVWNYKRWIRAPMAVREDGPILKYRRWVKQFFDREGGELLRDFDGTEQIIERQTRH
jgi:cholesterol 7-dehydrogenase